MEIILIASLVIGAGIALAFVALVVNILLTDRARTHHTCDYRVPPCPICARRYSHNRS
ncbi:hypothetical protein [Acrocarpospora sp. B8E8]|uniref:hypothetical protein n=1 Tax=Acrocarpospora sp. B8E8 TaxID=3153572 RepID=UPI00325F69C2